jgi:soluble lytic murein transglycosylase-like protein
MILSGVLTLVLERSPVYLFENKMVPIPVIRGTIDPLVSYVRFVNDRVPTSVAKEIISNVRRRSEEMKLPVELIIGLMEVESSFDPMTVSNRKARGLLQILDPPNHLIIDRTKIHDIDYNVEIGCRILSYYLAEKKDYRKALVWYSGDADDFTEKVERAIGRLILFEQQEAVR